MPRAMYNCYSSSVGVLGDLRQKVLGPHVVRRIGENLRVGTHNGAVSFPQEKPDRKSQVCPVLLGDFQQGNRSLRDYGGYVLIPLHPGQGPGHFTKNKNRLAK